MRRWRKSFLVCAMGVATVACALAPASPAGAGNASQTVPAGPVPGRTDGPRCTFTIRTTRTMTGTTVTALGASADVRCESDVTPVRQYVSFQDRSLPCCVTGIGTSGYPVVESDRWNAAIVNPSSVTYERPKTGHPYAATLSYWASLPPGVAPKPSPNCAVSGSTWNCSFDLSVPVTSGPEVGPPPAPAPVSRSITLPMTDGSSCVVTLDLAALDSSTLSYQGHNNCAGDSSYGPY